MSGPDNINSEVLSDVIGAIYDCALEPQRWQQTVKLINAFCDSPFGGLGIIDSRAVAYRNVYDDGYAAEFVAMYPKYEAMNPIFQAASLRDVGQVNTQAMLIDEVEFLESRYYRECLSTFGYRDLVGFLALKSGPRVAFMHCGRYDSQPNYGDREMRLMRLLVPHVCRALKISDALDLRTLKSDMLSSTLNALSAGVFLLDAQGRVVHMNTAAERLLRKSEALSIVHGRLRPNAPAAQLALGESLASFDANTPIDNATSSTIPMPDKGDRGCIATVLPIDRGERRGVFSPFAAAAALFVQAPEEAPLMPGEAFAKLHGLTAGELRVLLAMTPGLGLKEAADFLGIAEATARTHLQRIFAKTGTTKQVELIQLLMASTPPVTAR